MGVSAIVDNVTLERFRMLALQYISEELVKDFAEQPELDISALLWMMPDGICLRVKQAVWGEGPFLGEPIEHPANWKEAIKERFAPEWFKRRWPVKQTVHRYNARILYPRISMPKEKHFLNVSVVTD